MTKAMKKPRTKRPELLDYLAQIITKTLIDLVEMDKEISEHLATDIVNQVAKNWGGQLLYIPQGLSLKICARDREIWNDFDGSNHAVLAKKYNTSVQWLYKIIKNQRAANRNNGQSLLFPEDDDDAD